MKKKLWVLAAVFVICFASFFSVSVYAQCNTGGGGVIVCSKSNALSYWQDDCHDWFNQVKFQRSNDGMSSWGDIVELNIGASDLDPDDDMQWEEFFRGKVGKKDTIFVPFFGYKKLDVGRNPLIVIMTTQDCGNNWKLHQIEVQPPEGYVFQRSLGCPELEAKITPEYFVLFATFIFNDGASNKGYGCVISTRDAENWTVSLTAEGQMPTQCEDD